MAAATTNESKETTAKKRRCRSKWTATTNTPRWEEQRRTHSGDKKIESNMWGDEQRMSFALRWFDCCFVKINSYEMDTSFVKNSL
jgi:hypothetical protein